MNKIIIATLFALLAVSAYGTGRTARTAGVACTTTTASTGCSACGASPFPCTAATGYYVLSGTATTPVACADNCASCASGATAPTVCTACYGTDESLYATAVKGTGGNGNCSVCATGAIKDSTAATAACINASTTDCYTGFAKNAYNGATGIACISTTTSASNTCMTGYSDVTLAAPTSGTLAGDCKYCALGYTDVAAGTTANAPATATCSQCLAATYSWTSSSATRVCATHATACVTGWTESSTGAAPGTRNSTTGGCVYCVSGKIADQTGTTFNCIDSSAACATGFVKNGGNATQTGYACVSSTGNVTCLSGWSQDATTKACTTAASSGNILMVSVAVLFSIIMIVF